MNASRDSTPKLGISANVLYPQGYETSHGPSSRGRAKVPMIAACCDFVLTGKSHDRVSKRIRRTPASIVIYETYRNAYHDADRQRTTFEAHLLSAGANRCGPDQDLRALTVRTPRAESYRILDTLVDRGTRVVMAHDSRGRITHEIRAFDHELCNRRTGRAP